jgi:magnesium-transporting ATPase (P-type)
MLHDICVGKTGTITKGILNVMKMQFCSDPTVHENDGALFFADELEVQAELKALRKPLFQILMLELKPTMLKLFQSMSLVVKSWK